MRKPLHSNMIKSITLTNIRCFTKQSFEFDERSTYIHGDNGTGKTSILEAIHMVSNGKSHRTNEDKHLILNDMPFGKISLQTATNTYDVVITPKGKRVWVDKQEIQKLSLFVGRLKSVLFSPEDIDLVKGSPQYKRQFLDVSMMQLDPTYIETLNIYKKLLKQRNALLKKLNKGQDDTFLNILSQQLSEYGKSIITQRQTFINTLNYHFEIIYQTLNNDEANVMYKANVSAENIEAIMIKNHETDMILNTTSCGPHRDDVQVIFNSALAKDKASQGQQRLLAVALKLAVLEMIKEHTKQPVVLLLDDVLSELDEDKQKLILSYQQDNQQTIINSALPKELTKGKTIALKGAKHE